MQRKWRRDWQRGNSHKKGGLDPFKTLAKSILPPVAAVGLLLGSMGSVYANPTDGQIISGTGTISENGGTMTINQTSDKLGINWQSFSIGKGEAVQFIQPGSSSVALNRVLGNDASSIYGSLIANGKVFLINPNGILFAPGSSVNVGGIVASTLNMSDSDFQAGNYKFAQDGSAGSVINQGTITATNYAVLLGPQVKNEGVIAAKATGLAAGNGVALDFNGDDLLNVTVDTAAAGATATNNGQILANGGLVIMSAGTKSALMGTAVNNSGIIQAQSLNNVNGAIYLEGDTVINSGTLDASGKSNGQTGGTVKVLGNTVTLADGAKVDVSGDKGGGTALIGGNYQGKGPERNATTTTVAANASINADAIDSGNGGKVVVWADDTTTFDGSISAKGGSTSGNGGSVETSGHKLTVGDTARVTATASNGTTGSWLLDPADFSIADSGGDMTTATLAAALANANVTITTGSTSNTVTEGSTTTTTIDTAGSSGNGDINVNNAVTWDSANTLTLSAYNNINLNSSITAVKGGLTLAANTSGAGNGTTTGIISPSSASSINVGTFTLTGGTWREIGNLSSFYTQDFRRNSGTFIRALGGDGTSTSSAYQISDVYGLQSVCSSGKAANYVLANDIDATGTRSWNDGAGFKSVYFRSGGVFDGDGHVINGLMINGGTGLFSVNAGTISNLGLENVNIIGRGAGALVGTNRSTGSITNCYSTGTVTGNSLYHTGGLVGINESGGSITNSYSAATVTISAAGQADAGVGGLVGKNSGKVDNCYSTGALSLGTATISTGGWSVGGLVGYNTDAGSIQHSYATGPVSLTNVTRGRSYVGGFVGKNNSTNAEAIVNGYSTGDITFNGNESWVGGFVGSGYGSIANAYSTGAVTVNGNNNVTGGFVGWNTNVIMNAYSAGLVKVTRDTRNKVGGFVGLNRGGTYINAYWDTDTSQQASGSGYGDGTVTGLTTADMKNATTMSGKLEKFADTWYMQDGVSRPFLKWEYDDADTTINSAHELLFMSKNLAGQYTLAHNIDIGSLSNMVTGGWLPVGSIGTPFTGSLDGNGYTIRGLTITGSTASTLGLFGCISNTANINDFNLTAVNISGGAGNTYVGALVGYNNGGSLTNVSSAGSVSGGDHTGGLVGYNTGTVVTSYSRVNVSGEHNVGGLVGTNAGSITDSYYTKGTVTGKTAGGIAGKSGDAASGATGIITGVYSNGAVKGSGDGSTIGALVGDGAGGTVTNSVWNTEKAGEATKGVGTNVTDPEDIKGLDNAGMRDYHNYPAGWFTASGASETWILTGAQPRLFWQPNNNIITTAADLQAIGDDLKATYILESDITLTGAWMPLGSESDPFKGTLIGNNHTINGLQISSSGATSIGLFGYAQDATISGLNLAGVNITGGLGNLYVGSLAGYSGANNIITGCSSSGTVTANGDNSYIGGLVGYNTGKISDSISTVAVTGNGQNSNIGGLVGLNDTLGTLSYTYAVGSVTANGAGSRVGGLAGSNKGGITGSGDMLSIGGINTTGTVGSNADSSFVGGLVGENTGNISDSSHKGAVQTTTNATNNKIGGLIGVNSGTITGTSNTATVDAAGADSYVGGMIGENNSSLTGLSSTVTVTASGAGSTIGGLVGVNNSSLTDIKNTGAVTVTADETIVGGMVGLNASAGSITRSTSNGVADSSGTVTVTGAASTVGGLSGTNNGTMSSSAGPLYSSGAVTVSGTGSYAGGLVGINNSNVSNGYSSGAVTVSGTGSYAGGLVGTNNGTISGSWHNTGAVIANDADSKVGGLVGLNASAGEITDSYNTAAVAAHGDASRLGGLVGINDSTVANSIADSYNTGAVTSEGAGSYVGGLVGENAAGDIIRSSNTGMVTVQGQGSFVGGLAGRNAAIIGNSYNQAKVEGHGETSTVGGLIGKNDGGLSDVHTIGTVTGDGTGSTVGGLVGENTGSVDYAYSLGKVTGSGTVGGLAGANSGNVAHSFWYQGTFGQNSVGSGSVSGISALTTKEQLMDQSYLTGLGWNFTSGTWGIIDGQSMPYLSWKFSGYTPQFVWGTVQDGGTGKTVNMVFGGKILAQATTLMDDGYYYITAPSAVMSKMAYAGSKASFLYVADNGNFKANGLYRYGTGGIAGGDLIKDTLIIKGTSSNVFSLNEVYTNAGQNLQNSSPDLLFSSSNATIQGDVLASELLLGDNRSLNATGSITINNTGDFYINVNNNDRLGLDHGYITFLDTVANQQIIAGGNISITTGGYLVLKHGNPDSFYSTVYGQSAYTQLIAGGDVILHAEGGFANYSGPEAIQCNGRWLIYAPDQLVSSADRTLYFADFYTYQRTLGPWGGYYMPGVVVAANYEGIWKNPGELYVPSDELVKDVRGGLTGNFLLWAGDTAPATGSGFIFAADNPAVRALTPTQLERREAVITAHSGTGSTGLIQNLIPVMTSTTIPGTSDALPFLTIVDGGIATDEGAGNGE